MTTQAAQNVSHTPGPWEITGRCGDLKCEIGNNSLGRAVATVWDCVPDNADPRRVTPVRPVFFPEGVANAHLIAAAPELLDALKAFVAASDGASEFCLLGQANVQARAAIAKAEGR